MNEAVQDKSMVTVTLPDGSRREVDRGASVLDVAKSIGSGLAKATVGARIDDDPEIVDLRAPIERDCRLHIITNNSTDGLAVIRHSASHVMADAICRLWPDAKLSIGPSTADGFYYDIDLEHRIADEDLERIEKMMGEVIKENLPFEKCDVDRAERLDRYAKEGEIYKVELIEGFDETEPISTYKHGEFEDLCRGPHVPSTGYIKAWKILKVAGAYWRGDEKRQMLQRIYGTAFNDRKALDEHLELLDEAKKRDHRKLGRELDLFSFHESAPASPLFHPKGALIYNLLQDFMREKYRSYGYDEVITPQIFDVQLWKTSGHWDKYKDNMFFTHFDKAEYAVKPMNCPSHALIYGATHKSYRDLPIRMADFGRLHRYERSGVTQGLTRVRTFCQDDGHIFCRTDQIGSEISSVIKLLNEVYSAFGFDDVKVYLSTRPEQSIGSDDVWEKAEQGLVDALEANAIDYTVNPGDGAFYGPKIDFIILDALKREWQLGTVQLDFNLPERFKLDFQNAEGDKERPVVVHRAILGSLERFMGIIIEHFGGNFPVWLAPVQARVLTISEAQVGYAEEVVAEMRRAGLRVEADFGNERVGGKIRDTRLMRVPFWLVIGQKEMEAGTVNVNERGNVDLGAKTVEEFCAMMRGRIEART